MSGRSLDQLARTVRVSIGDPDIDADNITRSLDALAELVARAEAAEAERDKLHQVFRDEMARCEEYTEAYRAAERDLAKEKVGHAGQKRLQEGERARGDRAVARVAELEAALREVWGDYCVSHETLCKCGLCSVVAGALAGGPPEQAA